MAKRLEKSIEEAFCKWLEDTYGKWVYLPIKLNLFGRRGLPDRLILGPGKFILFIEFKRPDEKPRKLQLFYHRLLKGFGFHVEVCDDTEEAKRKFLKHL